MKHLFTITLILLAFTSHSQLNKLVEKYAKVTGNAKGAMEFFSDEALTQPLDKIEDGVLTFYVKNNMDKQASRLCEYSERIVLRMTFDDDRNIYSKGVDTGQRLVKIASDPGFYVIKVDFSNEEHGHGILKETLNEATEQRNYSLTFEASCPGRNKVVSEGEINMDLTNGNDKYHSWIMEGREDFSLSNYKDGFKDDALKANVIKDLENRDGVTIHQFKWGERVPYVGDDLLYYRRHTAVVTYTDSDGTCFSAGLGIFDVSSNPSAYGYKYENDATYSNTEQIPCDRVNM